jgi:hypothetical protein
MHRRWTRPRNAGSAGGIVSGQRHLGDERLQPHPVLPGGARQGGGQVADLGRVADDSDEVLREPGIQRRPVPGLSVSQSPLAVQQQQLRVRRGLLLMPGQDTLQGQVDRRGPQPRRIGRAVRQDVSHATAGESLDQGEHDPPPAWAGRPMPRAMNA